MNIGEPFYTERGKKTGPYTYEAIGTLYNVGKIINNGVILTLPLQNDLVFGKCHNRQHHHLLLIHLYFLKYWLQ
jgi:hypothetical protein